MSGERLTNAERDRRIAEICGRQDGRIRAKQLKSLGMSSTTITRWRRRGRLHRVARATYSVGYLSKTRRAQFMEAYLGAGEEAALTFGSCAELWGLPVPYERNVHVTVPVQRRDVAGVVRHTSKLAPDEVTLRQGMRVATVARLLLDLAAAKMERRQLEILMEHARHKNLRYKTDLHRLLERYPRRAGTRVLREILASDTIGKTLTLSQKEEVLLAVVERFNLPRGVANHVVRLDNGAEVWPDYWYAREGVVVEVQSETYHGSWFAQRKDMVRAADLAASDIVTVPVAWEDLVENPRDFADRLRKTLAARAKRHT